MNIIPSRSYKKPLYVLGVATAIMTIAVTGCTDPKTKTLQPDADNPAYSGEAVIMGEAELPEIDYIEETDPQDEGRVVLSGGVEIEDPD